MIEERSRKCLVLKMYSLCSLSLSPTFYSSYEDIASLGFLSPTFCSSSEDRGSLGFLGAIVLAKRPLLLLYPIPFLSTSTRDRKWKLLALQYLIDLCRELVVAYGENMWKKKD